jgi:hypothetical protein
VSLGREKIYSALFNVLQTQAAQTNPAALESIKNAGLTPLPVVSAPAFKFASRRYTSVGKLESTQYPALMMQEMGETYHRETLMRGPANVDLVSHVIIQTFGGQDPNVIPAIEVNNLADLVEDLIETGAGQFLQGASLLAQDPDAPGGLVFECRISGREVVYAAVNDQVYSQQNIEVEIIATH